MNLKYKLAGIMAGTAACLALATTATAQVSADALLDKLVAKGILTQTEAEELKNETVTNNPEGLKVQIEQVGDPRAWSCSATCGCATNTAPPNSGRKPGIIYDTANRWRYALRVGVRGDLAR